MKPRVMIATPTYDSQVCTQFVQSIMAATVYCLYHGVEIELNVADRYSLIQYARNRLAQDFLNDESFTHLLWIDSDVGFDPRAIVRLLAHDKDVVGGAYPVKAMPSWFPVQTTGDRKEDGLFQALTLPTGFLLCSRAAMQAVAETVPVYTHHHGGEKLPTRHIFDLELVDGEDGTKDLIGEDVVLCHRLRGCGFDLWLDPDIDFQHVGTHRWAGNMARTLEAHETPKTTVESAVSRVLRSSAA